MRHSRLAKSTQLEHTERVLELVRESLRKKPFSENLRRELGISGRQLEDFRDTFLRGGEEHLRAVLDRREDGEACAYAVKAVEDRAARLLKLPNVVGCAMGRRQRKGRYTLEPCLTVFVRRKVSREKLKKWHRIPSKVRMAAEDGEGWVWVRVDVVESGEPRRSNAAAGAASSPVAPGESIAHQAYPASRPNTGTFGCVVRAVSGTYRGSLCLLSNFHVLQPPGNAFRPFDVDNGSPRGGLVISPSREDAAGSLPVAVAELVKGVRNDFVDAALATLTSPANLDFNIGGVAMPIGTRQLTSADVGRTAVQFFGRTSGHRSGIVRHLNGQVLIDGFITKELILTDQITQGGDSGSILLDLDWRVVGMLVGSTASHSLFMPFQSISINLGCELVTAA